MAYNRKDHFFKKAKEQGYAPRSIFKLEEIDQKFHVFKASQTVLDLGAAPGSWSQYAASRIGARGKLIGIDLEPVRVSSVNAEFYQGDILTILQQRQVPKCSFDIVMSDMAPKTTGIRITDQARSLGLCELAFEVAKEYLKPQGWFICKMFHSEEFKGFQNLLKSHFLKVEALRPESTRKESKEIFFIARAH